MTLTVQGFRIGIDNSDVQGRLARASTAWHKWHREETLEEPELPPPPSADVDLQLRRLLLWRLELEDCWASRMAFCCRLNAGVVSWD